MKWLTFVLALVAGTVLLAAAPVAQAAPCMIVTLTGTMGGPPEFNGLAGPGTLVRYGDDANNCSAVKMQFDAGRGTVMRLSQLNVPPAQVNAVFFTHMHSDHTDGFADLMQSRWHFNSKGPKVDVVCSADTASILGFTISCQKFVAHLADAYIHSGEIAQRLSEDKSRLAGGPADLIHLVTFEATNEPQVVWTSGDVKVSAIRSTHMAGHASYRAQAPPQTKSKSSRRVPTSSCIRQSIPLWLPTRAAECFRKAIIARARPPISAQWPNAPEPSTSCLPISSRQSVRSAKAHGRFRAVR